MIQIGKTCEIKIKVGKENTAAQMGSGSLDVFATPSMIAVMEKSACECVKDMLEDGTTSVGTKICAEHLAATPIGAEVTCKCRLTEAEGRKLSFYIEAYDNAGIIGKAEHTRVIVNADRFMEKASEKVKSK